MKQPRIIARAVFAALAATLVPSVLAQTQTAPQRPKPTLKVGDPAPPLAVSTWLKGTPFTNLSDGKVHVVEFWATWCGPCKGSMPHLSEIAKRFRGKAEFVGVDVWETAHGGPKDPTVIDQRVKSFVGYAGDMMDYNVAADTTDGTMAESWLQAAGQNGIPCSFVIDQQGKIAWIGHPLFGLGDVVDLVEKRQFDAAAGQRISAEWDKRFETYSATWTKFGKALDAKDYAKAKGYVEEVEKLRMGLGDVDIMRMSLLMNTDHRAARVLAEKVLGERANDPLTLFQLATTMIEAPSPTKEDAKVALKLAEAGAKHFAPNDPNSLSVLAEAYHAAGDDVKAADRQKRYVEYLSTSAMGASQVQIEQEKAKLKTYRAGKH